MAKFFTIAVSGLTPEQEQALATAWKGHGWWHGVPNFWLFIDSSGNQTAISLRDTIRNLAPLARVMVVEVSPVTWAGSTMTEPNREWLRKFWPPEGGKS